VRLLFASFAADIRGDLADCLPAKGLIRMRRSAAAREENKLGQLRGEKGNRTQRAIMEAVADLLNDRPMGDIRVTEVARVAGIVPPNFYTYFQDVEEVVLALATQLTSRDLSEHIEPDWSGEAGLERAKALVEAAFTFWASGRTILLLMHMLADQGRPGFIELRARQMRSTYKHIEAMVRKAQQQGRIAPEINARLVSYEAVGLVSSVALRCQQLMKSGFSRRQLIDTTARILLTIATGLP
jgi:AcrR family transcriptional regulator